MRPLKHHFLLDPEIAYLNHGSFGATPRPVFDVYQAWQRSLERDPVHFVTEELPSLLRRSRSRLAEFLNADTADLVYVPNTTFGINVVARAMPLNPGDEVLTTDHEYGAVDNAWSYACGKRGASYVRQAVSFPAASDMEILEEIWEGVTAKTKVVFLSHVTSPTGLRLPVEGVCRRAREAGILTVVDGAHAPGQIDVDLRALGADFYVGNCHKWLCAPKGAAFLFTKPERQRLIEPLVVGWGWGENRRPGLESEYVESLQWLGTNDLSAYLSVPAAIAFQEEHHWPRLREQCRGLLEECLTRISDLTGMSPLYPPYGRPYEQMAAAPLPHVDDPSAFAGVLYNEYRIQVPCFEWNGRQLIRVSVQAYNSRDDVDRLLAALGRELYRGGGGTRLETA